MRYVYATVERNVDTIVNTMMSTTNAQSICRRYRISLISGLQEDFIISENVVRPVTSGRLQALIARFTGTRNHADNHWEMGWVLSLSVRIE